MKKTDFETMNIKALKKYILEHRNDLEAWDFFMSLINAQPSNELYGDVDVQEFSELLRKHQQS